MRKIYILLICILITCGVFYLSISSMYVDRNYKLHFRIIKDDLKEIKNLLLQYEKEYKRLPSNDEGLSSLVKLNNVITSDKYDYEKRYRVYRNNGFYIQFTDAGLLDGWYIPYCYENRAEADDVFNDSPVNKDTEHLYSIEIKKDVYVYSVGGYKFYDIYRKYKKEYYIKVVIVILLILLFAVLYVMAGIKARKKMNMPEMRIVSLQAILAVLASVFIGGAVVPTCYMMVHFDRDDRPEMAATYSQLLEKYYKAGVIKKATYDKIQKTLKDIPAIYFSGK